MEFINELANPPAPPPPPVPMMPYRVEYLTYGGLGATSARPTKIYPDRGGDCLTADEVGVYEYVKWLEGAIATPAAGPAPLFPYRVELMSYGGLGVTSQRLTKLYPTWGGELLSPDECAVWEYVQALEAKLKAAQVERELSVLDGPFAPAEAVAETLSDLTGLQPAADEGGGLTKRQRAERALLEDPEDSNSAIGRKIGASHELVRQVRAELQAAGRLQPATEAAAGG